MFVYLKKIKPSTAHGPDGMSAMFFHDFSTIVGPGVCSLVLNILNKGGDSRSINYNYLCLIPKLKKPKNTKDFRSISLYNVSFKIVTKTSKILQI